MTAVKARHDRRHVAAELEHTDWAHTTRRILALDHDFAVRTTCPELGRHLDQLFASMAAPGQPAAVYSVVDRGAGADPRHLLACDDERLTSSNRQDIIGAFLFWHINRTLVEKSGRYVLIHASGAAWGDRGVVMPARMESGKSTLVAGLVQRGLGYLTDEAVAIDPVSGLIAPFPRPISLDEGSWTVLPELRATLHPAVEPYLSRQWQVPPLAIRADALAAPVPPAVVVAPRYQAGAATRLEPMSRAETVVTLAENSFNLADHGRRGFETLAAAVATADCYRLTVGDLPSACDAIMSLLSGTRVTTGPARPIPGASSEHLPTAR